MLHQYALSKKSSYEIVERGHTISLKSSMNTSVVTNLHNCDCHDFHMELPCRHVFYVRELKSDKRPLSELVAPRWRKLVTSDESSSVSSSSPSCSQTTTSPTNSSPATYSPSIVQASHLRPPAEITRETFARLAQELFNSASKDSSATILAERYQLLANICDLWDASRDFYIKPVEFDRIDPLEVPTNSLPTDDGSGSLLARTSAQEAPAASPRPSLFANKTLLRGSQPGRKKNPPNPIQRGSVNHSLNLVRRARANLVARVSLSLSQNLSQVDEQVPVSDQPAPAQVQVANQLALARVANQPAARVANQPAARVADQPAARVADQPAARVAAQPAPVQVQVADDNQQTLVGAQGKREAARLKLQLQLRKPNQQRFKRRLFVLDSSAIATKEQPKQCPSICHSNLLHQLKRLDLAVNSFF